MNDVVTLIDRIYKNDDFGLRHGESQSGGK